MKACKVLERLGVTRRTLNNYVKFGKIRVKKLSNGFYEYDENDVDALEKNAIKPNTITLNLENGIRHAYELTFDQALELSKIITDFLKL